jgi:hypothetical protein
MDELHTTRWRGDAAHTNRLKNGDEHLENRTTQDPTLRISWAQPFRVLPSESDPQPFSLCRNPLSVRPVINTGCLAQTTHHVVSGVTQLQSMHLATLLTAAEKTLLHHSVNLVLIPRHHKCLLATMAKVRKTWFDNEAWIV